MHIILSIILVWSYFHSFYLNLLVMIIFYTPSELVTFENISALQGKTNELAGFADPPSYL